MEIKGVSLNSQILKKNRKSRVDLPYEFRGLNFITEGGSGLGDLVVIVGNTGLGKSTLATQMVGYWWKSGYKTLIYSGEMDAARH